MDEKHRKMMEESAESAVSCSEEGLTHLGENCCISTGEILQPKHGWPGPRGFSLGNEYRGCPKGPRGFEGPSEPGCIGLLHHLCRQIDEAVGTERMIDADGNTLCEISPYTLITVKGELEFLETLITEDMDHF